MKLKTERLHIVLLKPEQLELLVNNTFKLDSELECTYDGGEITGHFKIILKTQIRKAKADRDNYMWHSFWLIIRNSDNTVVGSADFKDIPNEMGEVEIGYGLEKKYEHQGYMTEAVRAMCDWAKKQKNVKHVIAETELDGKASQRVLERCGFKEYLRNNTIWWRN